MKALGGVLMNPEMIICRILDPLDIGCAGRYYLLPVARCQLFELVAKCRIELDRQVEVVVVAERMFGECEEQK